jgi:hypothetical protein
MNFVDGQSACPRLVTRMEGSDLSGLRMAITATRLVPYAEAVPVALNVANVLSQIGSPRGHVVSLSKQRTMSPPFLLMNSCKMVA